MTLQPRNPPSRAVFSVPIHWNISASLVLCLSGLGNAILIKSHTNMGRCWRLVPNDYPNCQRARYRGEFNNLRKGLQKSVVVVFIRLFHVFVSNPGWVLTRATHGTSMASLRFLSLSTGLWWRQEWRPKSWRKYCFCCGQKELRDWVLLPERPGIFPGSPVLEHSSLWASVSSSVKQKYFCSPHQLSSLLIGLGELGFSLEC